MKSILIIGMGKFGHHLCENLLELGNDVMIIDREEEKVSDLVYKVTKVQIGDCTNPKVVDSLGIKNFDMVIVCIGSNFQASLEITSLVKEKGAKRVISKANRDVHAKFLLKNGADEVIYPDRDIAETLAREYSRDSVFDYLELDATHSMYEIKMPKEWVGKTLRNLDIRNKYQVNVIGIKKGEELDLMPDPNHEFIESEHLCVLGEDAVVEKLLKKVKLDY